MTQEEEIKELIKKLKTKSLVINRVPKKTKAEFMNFAEEEFCDDYGACLKYVWDFFKIWKVFFENMDMKLDIILNSLPVKGEKKIVKMLSGREIERREK